MFEGGGATGLLNKGGWLSDCEAAFYHIHYCNRINFWHGLIFVTFGPTKNAEIYFAHAHCMP